MRRRFFVERFDHGRAHLAGDAAHHLGRVLRAEPGQIYELSDGAAVYLARVEKVERGKVVFVTLEPVGVHAPPLKARLLLSIVKFDRFEWALEKAVELGVETIVPLAAERSEKALVVAAAKRSERWRKILLESAQQARCLRPPVLETVSRAHDAFRSTGKGLRILLSERAAAAPLRTVFREEAPDLERVNEKGKEAGVTIAVGPEGGWTEAEFASAKEGGFREARVGENILRTETAVAAGLAAAHLYFDA